MSRRFQDKILEFFNFLAFFLIKIKDILGVSDFLSCWNSLPKNVQLGKEVTDNFFKKKTEYWIS